MEFNAGRRGIVYEISFWESFKYLGTYLGTATTNKMDRMPSLCARVYNSPLNLCLLASKTPANCPHSEQCVKTINWTIWKSLGTVLGSGNIITWQCQVRLWLLSVIKNTWKEHYCSETPGIDILCDRHHVINNTCILACVKI